MVGLDLVIDIIKVDQMAAEDEAQVVPHPGPDSGQISKAGDFDRCYMMSVSLSDSTRRGAVFV